MNFKRNLSVGLQTLVTVIGVSSLVAACGGGGGAWNGSSSGGSGSNQPLLQGLFTGTSSGGENVQTLVLEDGSFWDIYGVSSASGLSVQGVATGSSTSGNGSFTMSYNDFLTPGATPISGIGSGTYTSSTLIGTDTESGQTATFNLTAPVSAIYNYGTPAALSAISGSWTGTLLDGETGTISITPSGSLTGTTSLGCSVTGTIIPRPSGVNVFNVSLTFGDAPCVIPNQPTSGVAVTYPLGNGTNQLIVGLVTPSITAGTAFSAVR